MGTDTARLSSRAGDIKDGYSGINFQGIPRDSDEDKPELFKAIREIITPREGYVLVKLDFAGEELRVVTNLSGDPIWTKSFLYEDGDVHSITAKTLFGKADVSKDERNRGKRCNFAFIYGGGSGAIQRNIGCTKEEAQTHMDNLKRDVPVLMGYVEQQKHIARKNDMTVVSEQGETDATVEVKPASPFTAMTDAYLDRIALYDMIFKNNMKIMKSVYA